MIEEEPKGERRETNRSQLFPWLLLQQMQGQTLKVLMARRPWTTLTFWEGFGYLISNSLSSNSVIVEIHSSRNQLGYLGGAGGRGAKLKKG